ncbi:unnamed protein product [Caenorhabditis auriculariae]|uniref:Major facilitator superfamily (MFS) profile domain-containing protein n=1 Tax=Caenorhabditis auriculariae TaxID=2777116 RepID=A0A8S1HCJ3_9PELO|nr:unnamed protein product [Caenorhabditis auriculariae]
MSTDAFELEASAFLNDSTKLKDGVKEQNSADLPTKTDWKAIYVIGLITFVAFVVNFLLESNRWPYLQEVDTDTTAEFFGVASAASKAGHAVFTLVFSYWSYHYQCVKPPIVFGCLISLISCVFYFCVELLTDNRRYLMAMCFVLFGAASSNITVLRAYIASASLPEDRTKAFSASSLSILLAVIVAPIIQISFSKIPYPGWEVLPDVRFHIYTGPVALAALINVVVIGITWFCLRELPKRKKFAGPANGSTIDYYKAKMTAFLNLDIKWGLVLLCCCMKAVFTLCIVILMLIMPVLYTTSYGWSGTTLVQISAISMGTAGILSLVVGLLYAFLGKYIPQRVAFLFALFVFGLLFVFTYPYEAISNPVAPYNETTNSGCNPEKYDWCQTAVAPPAILLVVVQTAAISLCMPIAIVSLDAIYSKILGQINQSMLQGAFIIFEDIVFIVGPIVLSAIFTEFGTSRLWLVNIGVVAAGVIAWILCFRNLKPYS